PVVVAAAAHDELAGFTKCNESLERFVSSILDLLERDHDLGPIWAPNDGDTGAYDARRTERRRNSMQVPSSPPLKLGRRVGWGALCIVLAVIGVSLANASGLER